MESISINRSHRNQLTGFVTNEIRRTTEHRRNLTELLAYQDEACHKLLEALILKVQYGRKNCQELLRMCSFHPHLWRVEIQMLEREIRLLTRLLNKLDRLKPDDPGFTAHAQANQRISLRQSHSPFQVAFSEIPPWATEAPSNPQLTNLEESRSPTIDWFKTPEISARNRKVSWFTEPEETPRIAPKDLSLDLRNPATKAPLTLGGAQPMSGEWGLAQEVGVPTYRKLGKPIPPRWSNHPAQEPSKKSETTLYFKVRENHFGRASSPKVETVLKYASAQDYTPISSLEIL